MNLYNLKKYILIVVLGIGIAWALYLNSNTSILPVDDAYITYKYAQNLVKNIGPVYNEDEKVCGTSSPLFPYLLYILYKIFKLPIPVLGHYITLISFILCGLLIGYISEKFKNNLFITIVFIMAFFFNPQNIETAFSGMETFTFLFFLGIGLFLFIQNKFTSSGILISIACLLRFEGIVCAGILSIFAFKKHNTKFVFILASLLSVYFIFSFYYYGSFLPNSIIAKLKPIYPIARAETLKLLIHYLEIWLFNTSFNFLKQLKSVISVDILIIFSITILFYKNRLYYVFPLCFWGIFLFYAISNTHMHAWYYPIVYFFWIILLITGLGSLSRFKARFKFLKVLFILIVIIPLCIKIYLDITTFNFLKLLNSSVKNRILAYKKAAQFLNKYKKSTVCAPEIGMLGYYYKGKILDACGLVSKETLPFLPVDKSERLSPHIGAVPGKLVEVFKPPYIVSHPIFIKFSLLKKKWFFKNYRLMNKIKLGYKIWESEFINIYVKRE